MDGEKRQDRRILSPLVVGIAVALIGAAVAVASTLFIADPRLGVLAAIVLSFGCVGTAAGLVLARRKSWTDPSWPPDAQSKPWTVRRTRRVSLLYGVFLVLMSLAGTATLVGTEQPGIDDAGRGWVIVGVLALVGLLLTVTGARRAPEAVSSSDRPATTSVDGSEEWVRLGSSPRGLFSWWAPLGSLDQPFLIPTIVGAVFFPLTAFRFGAWAWVLVAAGLLATVAIVGVMLHRRSQPPSISRDATRMLIGKAEVPSASVIGAMVIASPWEPDATARNLAVVFSTSGKARAVVGLRNRGHLALSEDQTALLAAAIEQSDIQLPHDKDDPKGRFSRSLYPNYLTKADAVRMVENPPGDGDRLPVGPPSA